MEVLLRIVVVGFECWLFIFIFGLLVIFDIELSCVEGVYGLCVLIVIVIKEE